MGGGASVADANHAEVVDLVSLRMRRFPMEENTRLICAIIDIAHDQGIDLHSVQARVNQLLQRQTSWPWSWSENAQKALGGDFRKIPGFSHMELCIYKENSTINTLPFIDERFDNELVALFSAFYREHDENLHPLKIVEIIAIHNPILEEGMVSSTLKIHEQVTLGGAYERRWTQLESAEAVWNKEQTLDVLGLADPHGSFLGFAGQSDPAVCRNICSNGFADLAKTDPGYFGRGVYLSPHSEYAALYAASDWGGDGAGIMGSINDIPPGSEFTLLAGHAVHGVCYPITRDTDYSSSFCWSDLKGQGMKFGYHSHAVLVNRLRLLRQLNYQAMQPISTGQSDPLLAYGEVVLQHTAQVFPRYIMRCRRRDDARLAVSPGKERLQSGFLQRPVETEVFPAEKLTADMQALVELFEESGGVHWTVKTNWCRDLAIDTWMGPHWPVSLDKSGAVSKLRLASNNLTGTLVPSIGNLIHLIVLDLSENQLHGSIPSGIGELQHLEELYLDRNLFHGDLPVPIILQKAKLGRRCRIGLQQHDTLAMRLPSAWTAAKLEEYLLADRSLLEVDKLLLRECSLRCEIPLSMLHVLSGSSELGYQARPLLSLIEIDMACNNLGGPVPSQFDLFSALQRLDLSRNQLNGGVPDLSALTALRDLDLSSNELAGNVPQCIASMSSLRNVDLSSNQFNGDIPPDYFAKLTELVRWAAANNALTGLLPPSATCMQKLILFAFDHNEFNGEIPECYAALSALRGFDVSHNKLTGAIPERLVALPGLQRFEAACNKLSGPLPLFGTSNEEGHANRKLRIINLSGNEFVGEVPRQWSQLSALDTVNLENNSELTVHSRGGVFSARVELMY